MTVAEIKEYIDNKLNTCAMHEQTRNYLKTIYSMLDELEQPIEIDTEKYFETIDKIASEYFRKQVNKQKKFLKENNK